MYLNHIVGFRDIDSNAISSNYSIYIFAIAGDNGEPIAVNICVILFRSVLFVYRKSTFPSDYLLEREKKHAMITAKLQYGHNSIFVTDYLTKTGIKTVCHPPYSPDLAPCDFCLFPKLRGCHYETIEEMKEAVTKVIGTLTQEDFHRAFQKLLEQYNKCIAAGGDYFEGD